MIAAWILNAIGDTLSGFSFVFDSAHIPYLVYIFVHQMSTGLWEEALFRGFLMLPVLLYLAPNWDKTSDDRLWFVITCGIIFGLVHFNQGIFGILATGAIGMLFSAVFIYSQNLLVLILAHFLHNILINLRNLMLHMHSDSDTINNDSLAVTIVFSAILIAVSLYVTKKAKPFVIT